MSFAFSFSGDDIDVDEDDITVNHTIDDPNNIVSQLEATNLATPTSASLISPARHSFRTLLDSLPSQLSYNLLEVPALPKNRNNDVSLIYAAEGSGQAGGTSLGTRIPRRALFDIRQQLMHEVDPTIVAQDTSMSKDNNDISQSSSDATENLLAGLETGDLSTGIYEGGFKTWECAVDLASFLISDEPASQNPDSAITANGTALHVIELGAGSAIPGLAFLQRALRNRLRASDPNTDHRLPRRPNVRFTFCDYNEDVLRLCTAVNAFLTIALESGFGRGQNGNDHPMDESDNPQVEADTQRTTETDTEADLEITDALVHHVLETLESCGISIDFVSGAWGTDFTHLLHLDTPTHVLLLASETIYSPASLGVFTETVLDILAQSTQRDASYPSRALVAAKKVYFGVGGGVAEFEDELYRRSARADVVADVKGVGVGRVVLEVFGS